MPLRYELTARVPHCSSGASMSKTDGDLAGLRAWATDYLVSLYGPGRVYSDGWRFLHVHSPHNAEPLVLPPRIGLYAPRCCDVAISLRLLPGQDARPPLVTLAEVAARTPSLMLYHPRLSADELAWLALLALARRPRLLVAVCALLLLWVALDGLHG